MKIYTGTIVEESLRDSRILNKFKILNVKITEEENPEERWHIFSVEVSEDDIGELAENLKPSKWYCHFWYGDQVVAIFPQKIFYFDYKNKETWKEALSFGKSIGIPESQLDFVIEKQDFL